MKTSTTSVGVSPTLSDRSICRRSKGSSPRAINAETVQMQRYFSSRPVRVQMEQKRASSIIRFKSVAYWSVHGRVK